MRDIGQKVLIGLGCALIIDGEQIELVTAISEKAKRLEMNHWPTPKPHEVEPWQNKRRTPWRKRK